MTNKTPTRESLVTDSNEIRKIDPLKMSFDTKEFLIDTFKGTVGYQKDEQKKLKALQGHQEKKEVLSKLESQGVDQNIVDDVRMLSYPDHQDSIKTSESSEKISTGIDPATWIEIEKYANENSNTKKGKDLEKIKGLNYSRRINENGIIIHKIGGKEIVSMVSEDCPYGTFSYVDLNNNVNDYSKGRDRDNLSKNNKKYNTMLTQAGAVHQNFEEYRDMMFSIMQLFADELKLGVTIDFDFIDNSRNDSITNTISLYMKTVFGTDIVIPYKIDNKTGLVSSLDCIYSHHGVFRDNFNGNYKLASFSKVVSSSSKK